MLELAVQPELADTDTNHDSIRAARTFMSDEPREHHGKSPGRVPRTFDSKTIFFLGLLLAGSGLVSPPVALVGGIAFGFTVEHPYRREASSLAKLLLQLSVILLGFGMNLLEVIHVGRSGFLYTAISISGAVVLGTLLGKCSKLAERRAT